MPITRKKITIRKVEKADTTAFRKKIGLNSDHQRDADTISDAIRKAAVDPEFCEKLVSSPEKVLGKMRGKELDPKMKVAVHQDTANVRHIVVPFVGLEVEELSSLELDALILRTNALQVCIMS